MNSNLEINPRASSNFAVADIRMAPGAKLQIGSGVVTERKRAALSIVLGENAEVLIGAGSWLRTELQHLRIEAGPNAQIRIGDEAFLNGCQLFAKQRIELGRRVWVGTGSRIFDSDRHDFDADHPEKIESVAIGDFTWVASDVSVLRGSRVGTHCVVGTRSLVKGEIPDHSLAFGVPAEVKGEVGDRSQCT